MRRKMAISILVLLVVIGALVGLYPQYKVKAQVVQPVLHYAAGVYDSRAYTTWRAFVVGGPVASGSNVSIVVSPAFVTLADGYTLNPFTANVSLNIGQGPNLDAGVTPSAVTTGPCPSGFAATGLCATLTVTTSNTHGQGDTVMSGSGGIQDAFQDAANQDGGLVYWQADTGTVTLNTGGLTTTTTTMVPEKYTSLGGSAIVETAITTSASWAVGISGSTASFCAANTTLTKGTNCSVPTSAAGVGGFSSPYTLTAVLFTMGTSDPGAGAIKAKVFGFTPVSPQN